MAFKPVGEETRMSDGFVLNLEDVEDKQFDVMPRGWYRVAVTNWSEEINGNPVVIKNEGSKLPVGTKGTNWEFTVVDDEKYETWKLWASYWHHIQTAGFWKALYKASGAFSDEELKQDMDMLEERDRIIGCEMWAQVSVKKYKGEDQNTIKALKHLSEREDTSGNTGKNPLAP